MVNCQRDPSGNASDSLGCKVGGGVQPEAAAVDMMWCRSDSRGNEHDISTPAMKLLEVREDGWEWSVVYTGNHPVIPTSDDDGTGNRTFIHDTMSYTFVCGY